MAVQRRAVAAAPAEDEGPSPLHPSQAAPEVVKMGITGAIAGVALVGLAMCALAALVTLFIVWVLPPPGTKDVATEMPWTRLAPFSAQHGAGGCAGAFAAAEYQL